jgi:hypothetical protein
MGAAVEPQWSHCGATVELLWSYCGATVELLWSYIQDCKCKIHTDLNVYFDIPPTVTHCAFLERGKRNM